MLTCAHAGILVADIFLKKCPKNLFPTLQIFSNFFVLDFESRSVWGWAVHVRVRACTCVCVRACALSEDELQPKSLRKALLETACLWSGFVGHPKPSVDDTFCFYFDGNAQLWFGHCAHINNFSLLYLFKKTQRLLRKIHRF